MIYPSNSVSRAPTKIPRGEERFAVDLDRLAGKEPRPGKNGVYYIQIRQATQIRMQVLQDYLQRKCDWDKSVLQCMSKSHTCILGMIL